MGFAVSAPTSSLLQSSSASSSGGRSSSLSCYSNFAISIPRNAVFLNIKCIPPLGFTAFAQWNGLKQLSTSISQYAVKIERKGKLRGKGVHASLFGVGAPEVLVIGVLALLVFGPKGLAEVARNMGKTIRAFQPTIKELQEVSREFKSTLEREIGLDDDDKSSSSNTTKPPVMDSTPDIKPEDPIDDEVQARANWLRGTLDQLHQEQAEERQKKEESENTESEADSQSPPQDTPEASDTAQDASSITPPTENHDSSPLQETASATPTDSPTPKAEAEV